MKVSELIHLLLKQDPDADVLILSMRSWPWEHVVENVTTRYVMARAVVHDNEESLDDGGVGEEEPTSERGTEKRDVLLVEGELRRYGSTTASRTTKH